MLQTIKKTKTSEVLYTGEARTLGAFVQQLIAEGCSMRDALFNGADFSGLNFRGGDFSNSHFVECKIHNTNLDGCNFTDSTLEMTDLSRAFNTNAASRINFSNATMDDVCLLNYRFSRCNFDNVVFAGSVIDENYFTDCSLVNTHFKNSNVYRTSITKGCIDNFHATSCDYIGLCIDGSTAHNFSVHAFVTEVRHIKLQLRNLDFRLFPEAIPFKHSQLGEWFDIALELASPLVQETMLNFDDATEQRLRHLLGPGTSEDEVIAAYRTHIMAVANSGVAPLAHAIGDDLAFLCLAKMNFPEIPESVLSQYKVLKPDDLLVAVA